MSREAEQKESLLQNPFLQFLALFLFGLFLDSWLPRSIYDYFKPVPPISAKLANEAPVEEKVFVLAEKLGEALIIASVLGLIVDASVKRRLAMEVGRDVFEATLGFDLTEEVKAHVKSILRLPFVRRGFCICYRLELCKGEGGEYLQVTSVTEFNVLNLTDRQEPYDFKSSTELYHAAGSPENRLVRMESPTLGLLIEGQALEQITSTDDHYRRALKEVRIKRAKAGAFHFKTTRVQHYPVEHTMVLDILEPPCVGIKIKVDAPPQLEVKVSFGVPGEVDHRPEDGLQVWSHPGVHLPGAHFRVSWAKPRPPGKADTKHA